MTKNLHKFKLVCLSMLGIAAFYYSFVFWNALFGSLIDDFYLSLPRPLFTLTTFFLIFFLCRVSGTLIFMPKPKLKEILFDGNPDPSLSQIVLKTFSVPFIKRVSFFVLMIALEMILRLQAVWVFLWNADSPFWQPFAETSLGALTAGWTVAAILMMELPWFFMFYMLSVPNHPNRLDEYKFGAKLFVFVIFVYAVMRLLAGVFPDDPSLAMDLLCIALTCLISVGIWMIMYRPCCVCSGCSACPVKAALKKLFCRKCSSCGTESCSAEKAEEKAAGAETPEEKTPES